ncbi:MAG: twin-arginine translocase TatA/TatE family subunit [Bacteroidia bacterium]
MTLLFLDIGGGELVLILLVIVMFFGADKIPEMARGLGKGMRQFKDATGSIQREIEKSIHESERAANTAPPATEAPKTETPQVKPPENSVAQKPADGPPFPVDKQAPQKEIQGE